MKMNQFLFVVQFLLIIGFGNGLPRFANYFQDNMVLQRAPQRAIVWGYSDSDALLTLTMNGINYTTVRRAESVNSVGEGTWSVTLDPVSDEIEYNIDVTQPSHSGNVTITLHKVLFGDVWFCSGQSNMQLTVKMIYNGSEEIANAGKFPKIRLFTTALVPSNQPVDELLGIDLNWSAAKPDIIGAPDWSHMSAVCWLFGRMIHQALNERPIGLIASSWGGTAIEYWLPPDSLGKCGVTTTTKENLSAVPTVSHSSLYNSMVYPFTHMVIYGVIWYQGESNADYNRDNYTCTFTQLIVSWRSIWSQNTNFFTDPTFPIGFVQLSTYTSDSNKIGGFPWIRWHQTSNYGYVPNPDFYKVFMAVACDLRDDPNGIQPRFKHDVGYRLTQAARAIAYGHSDVEFMGPIINQNPVLSPDTKTVNLTYGSAQSIEVRTLNGFEICCVAAECFNDAAWVETKIVDHFNMTVAVAIPPLCSDKKLFGIRYLWRETPCPFKQAALYSGADPNLPSPPYYKQF